MLIYVDLTIIHLKQQGISLRELKSDSVFVEAGTSLA